LLAWRLWLDGSCHCHCYLPSEHSATDIHREIVDSGLRRAYLLLSQWIDLLPVQFHREEAFALNIPLQVQAFAGLDAGSVSGEEYLWFARWLRTLRSEEGQAGSSSASAAHCYKRKNSKQNSEQELFTHFQTSPLLFQS
jgi:hypothetical protein